VELAPLVRTGVKEAYALSALKGLISSRASRYDRCGHGSVGLAPLTGVIEKEL
jgi:hypothetical protein